MPGKTLPLTLLVAVATTGVCVAVGVAAAPAPPAFRAPRLTAAPVAEVRGAPARSLEATAGWAPAEPPPVALLRAWDAQRAAAWASGDPQLLAPLYTPRSEAGRRDRAMLRAWAGRGLVVAGMRTQLLAVDERAHTRSTWTLRVTDRLVGGLAVGPGVRRPLPRDGVTTRTVRLRLVDGRWRVAAVRPGR